MISIKLYDKNKIAVQIHGRDFRELLSDVKSLRTGKYEEGIGWIFDSSQLDRLISVVGSKNVAYLTPYEEIKNGKKKTIPNDFSSIKPIKDKLQGVTINIPDFQRLGAGFLIDMKKCILADCVGTGKTIQSSLAIKYGFTKKLFSKVLIVCPNTIKYQWQSELSEKFGINKTLVINGTAAKRAKQWTEAEKADIIILNYETLLSTKDMTEVKKFNPDVIIVDEAHYIKNLDAQRTKAVHKIKAKHRWLLTGTPMENRPDEIYALMNYISPSLLGNKKEFERDYMCFDYNVKLKAPIFVGYRDLTSLHHKIKGYMIRRRIEDIPEADLASLPEIMPPTNVYVELNKDQIRALEYINANRASIIEMIRQNTATKQQEDALLGYDMLQVGLCHSCEVLLASKSGLAKKIVENTKIKNKDAGKIDSAIGIIEDLIEEGSKIVVFTELKASQKIMSEKLTKKGIKHLLLSSDTSPTDREVNKKLFTEDDEIKVFITTDAGKEGINLQASNYLINLDIPWKPSTYEQRMGRIRRLGSKHAKCFVINMMSVDPTEKSETIDQRRMRTIIQKQELIDTVVDGK
jgi:SNF2 family DNA or RNA helicase